MKGLIYRFFSFSWAKYLRQSTSNDTSRPRRTENYRPSDWRTRTTTRTSFPYWASALGLRGENFLRAQNVKLIFVVVQSEGRYCLIHAPSPLPPEPQRSIHYINYWPSARSRWLDIGQDLFLRFYGPRRSQFSFSLTLLVLQFSRLSSISTTLSVLSFSI